MRRQVVKLKMIKLNCFELDMLCVLPTKKLEMAQRCMSRFHAQRWIAASDALESQTIFIQKVVGLRRDASTPRFAQRVEDLCSIANHFET